MAATSSPDWLPDGWSVQFRAQYRGRSTVIYTDLETGKKFFSKDDLIRYTEKVTNRGEEPQPTNTKKPSAKRLLQLAATVDEYPEWLPDGWKVELRTRKSGTQAGREYKCYTDPLNKRTFYSKPEVFRYLKTIKRKSCKSRSHKMVVVEKHNVEDLPPGWILEIKVRKVANRIRRDPYYTDPVHGYVFRSKKEVIRYLQTGETSKLTIKPKSMGTNDIKLTDDEVALSSATKRQKFKHPVTRRKLAEARNSSELSGLDLQEIESSKLQDKRPTESTCALAPITEVSLEKHCSENLVEECVEAKGNRSQTWSSEPKAEPSSKQAGKRSSQRLAVLSNKCAVKRSKLQDKRVTDEAVPLKHSSESVIENYSKTKEGCSPRKSIQPKAKLSNKCEENVGTDGSLIYPGEVIFSEDGPALTASANTLTKKNSHMGLMEKSNGRRSQIDARKSKKKEKHNLPRRSSKRLAGFEPEPVNSLVSNVQALQVTTRKSSKGKGSRDAGLASDNFVKRASQQLGDASGTEVAHHKIIEIISTVQGETLSKVKRPFDGLELHPVDTLLSDEQTVHVATRKSSRGDANRDAGLASDAFINGESLQLGDASEPEVAHDTLTDIRCTSHAEPLSKGKTFLHDQLVPKDQHHRLKPENMETEKPGAELCFLFGSDPCLEFAFKTLTGELPIADAVDNKSILKPAADAVQKENSLETGSCSRKTRVISNKSKKAKGLKLLHRTSKRLAGAEPELLEPMSSERDLRKATAKSCRGKSFQAVDDAGEVSQWYDAGQGNNVAHALNTIINPEPHEESRKKIEKTLEYQSVPEEKPGELEVEKATVTHASNTIINPEPYEESRKKSEKTLEYQSFPEEKPRELEVEKATVENPVSRFSFPFLDTWSDPCLDFAFKTLTGEIPIEDDLFQGYFQENPVICHNQRDSLALPDFGSPNFFQSDIAPQFDAPEQSVSGQLSPMNSSLPPAGNVNLSNCNGIGFGQQLSMNSSFLPAGNLRFSSASGVGSGQYLSVNSSFSPAGNLGQPNQSVIGTQNPCLGNNKDFHGKVKS